MGLLKIWLSHLKCFLLFLEDLSSVPRIHVMCLTVTCNSSSKKTQQPSPVSLGICAHMDTHITENEINLVKNTVGWLGG